MKAVIQAGGKGTRLAPYTMVLPKPLMPVCGVPVIEMLIKWLRRNDITQGYVTVGYLAKLIKTLCGDGSQWGFELEYCHESEPLGTIGPLALLGRERLDDTFLVLNGDIITDLKVRDMVASHKRSGALLTIGVTRKRINIDLGVIERDGDIVVNFREKPVMELTVSMGIYCIEPDVLEYVPPNCAYGFDDLMYSLLDKGVPINTYEHQGVWMDIGRPEDFEKAQEVVNGNSALLGI